MFLISSWVQFHTNGVRLFWIINTLEGCSYRETTIDNIRVAEKIAAKLCWTINAFPIVISTTLLVTGGLWIIFGSDKPSQELH